MATTYTLRFKNRSGSQQNFLIYQVNVNPEVPNVQSLAWFAKPVADGADVDFTWTTDFGFVWVEQGVLASGITFKAAQFLAADLQTANMVTLSYQDGAFGFGKVSGGGAKGNLTIECDATIPPAVATVGVGMAGAPTFWVAAEPNFTCVFAPHPEYWIGVGPHAQGHVLDASALVANAKLEFPGNIYEMTATLNADNTWTITRELV